MQKSDAKMARDDAVDDEGDPNIIITIAGWLVGRSLTAFSTQCRSYRAFKVRLY